MRAHGAYTCLVSGGFTAVHATIAAKIGFDENRANTLLVGADGKLTGEVADPIFGREAKLETLHRIARAARCCRGGHDGRGRWRQRHCR